MIQNPIENTTVASKLLA